MNRQQIENELIRLGQSLRPDQALPDAVMARIARCGAPRATWRWRIPAAAALAASVLVALLVIHRSRRTMPRLPEMTMVTRPANRSVSPTLAQYQWACGQSAEVLDALLQEQPESAEPRVFRAGERISGNLNLN